MCRVKAIASSVERFLRYANCSGSSEAGSTEQMKKKEEFFLLLFVTYTILQSITSSEMCSLHLTHPSAHTLGAVGSR